MIPIEDLTDITLAIEDTDWLLSDESYLVMKVIKWWKLSSDEIYIVMKVIYWWKLPSDKSYLVMKVKIVQEVKRSDGLWRFACGDI